MCLSYKFRLKSTLRLSEDIKKNVKGIIKSGELIASLKENLDTSFKKLKKANIELTKLSVQEAPLKRELHPRLRDLHADKKSDVNNTSAIIMYDIFHILKEIDTITSDIKNIMADAFALMYRENRAISRMHVKIISLEERNKFSSEVANQLNILEEDIKTSARRLYEAIKSPDLLKEPFKKPFSISEKISELSDEAAGLEKVLERLNLSNVNEIVRDAEKELGDIKKIELAVVSVTPELKSHIAHIKGNIYLLGSSAAGRVNDRLAKTESNIDNSFSKMSSDAKKLFEEIVIIKKISRKS